MKNPWGSFLQVFGDDRIRVLLVAAGGSGLPHSELLRMGYGYVTLARLLCRAGLLEQVADEWAYQTTAEGRQWVIDHREFFRHSPSQVL